MTTLLSDSLKDLALDKDEFIGLMTKLIGESKFVQNNPRQGLVPEEARIVKHVLDVLGPFKKENGGPLTIEQFVFHKGRPNLKITYAGQDDKWKRNLLYSERTARRA